MNEKEKEEIRETQKKTDDSFSRKREDSLKSIISEMEIKNKMKGRSDSIQKNNKSKNISVSKNQSYLANLLHEFRVQMNYSRASNEYVNATILRWMISDGGNDYYKITNMLANFENDKLAQRLMFEGIIKYFDSDNEKIIWFLKGRIGMEYNSSVALAKHILSLKLDEPNYNFNKF
ncbi:MAG: hypothetical protein NTX03_03130 [Bacteroidetes bacterium]|nr:hypothetical protein [Bacteroidota bacterium]